MPPPRKDGRHADDRAREASPRAEASATDGGARIQRPRPGTYMVPRVSNKRRGGTGAMGEPSFSRGRFASSDASEGIQPSSRKKSTISNGWIYCEWRCVPGVTTCSTFSARKMVRKYENMVRDMVDMNRWPPGLTSEPRHRRNSAGWFTCSTTSMAVTMSKVRPALRRVSADVAR